MLVIAVVRQLIIYTVLLKKNTQDFYLKKDYAREVHAACRCIEEKAAACACTYSDWVGPMRGLGCNVLWPSCVRLERSGRSDAHELRSAGSPNSK